MARAAGAKPPASRTSPPPAANYSIAKTPAKNAKNTSDYTSEGVDDNDVFLLPISDFQVTLGLTILAAMVRLFRIYQPNSVVFDEVQYVPPESLLVFRKH